MPLYVVGQEVDVLLPWAVDIVPGPPGGAETELRMYTGGGADVWYAGVILRIERDGYSVEVPDPPHPALRIVHVTAQRLRPRQPSP